MKEPDEVGCIFLCKKNKNKLKWRATTTQNEQKAKETKKININCKTKPKKTKARHPFNPRLPFPPNVISVAVQKPTNDNAMYLGSKDNEKIEKEICVKGREDTVLSS